MKKVDEPVRSVGSDYDPAPRLGGTAVLRVIDFGACEAVSPPLPLALADCVLCETVINPVQHYWTASGYFVLQDSGLFRNQI